jgi:hypothetical protein
MAPESRYRRDNRQDPTGILELVQMLRCFDNTPA